MDRKNGAWANILVGLALLVIGFVIRDVAGFGLWLVAVVGALVAGLAAYEAFAGADLEVGRLRAMSAASMVLGLVVVGYAVSADQPTTFRELAGFLGLVAAGVGVVGVVKTKIE
jgi:hypothetical protein